jgi:hypothetical protein
MPESFKGTVARFSTLGFFHKSTLPRALVHGLKSPKKSTIFDDPIVNDPAETTRIFLTKFFLRKLRNCEKNSKIPCEISSRSLTPPK